MGPKPAKTEKSKEAVKPKSNGELSKEQRAILQALESLGGKDAGSMDIAKKAGTTKTHPDAPRAPIRNAMEVFEKHHLVTRKREGQGYKFSITDKGKQALSAHSHQDRPSDLKHFKDKEAGSAVKAALNPSNLSDPKGIECPQCHTSNPMEAIHCKECGTQLRAVQAALVAA